MDKIVKVASFLAGSCVFCVFAPCIAAVFLAVFLVGFVFSPRESLKGLKNDLQSTRNKVQTLVFVRKS